MKYTLVIIIILLIILYCISCVTVIKETKVFIVNPVIQVKIEK